jgi:hypothetical protein
MILLLAGTTTNQWTTITGLLGFSIVAGLLVGALVLSAREALKERRASVRRVDDVRSQVKMIAARRDPSSPPSDSAPSLPMRRVRVSGRAGATTPGRRHVAPSATASRDRSPVT